MSGPLSDESDDDSLTGPVLLGIHSSYESGMKHKYFHNTANKQQCDGGSMSLIDVIRVMTKGDVQVPRYVAGSCGRSTSLPVDWLSRPLSRTMASGSFNHGVFHIVK